MAQVGRNALCPCGSGKKHKKCCLGKPPEADPEETPEDRTETLERGTQGLHGLLAALGVLNVQSDRRLREHREEEFLRSEFKRLGKSDEEIDKMFPKGR